MRSQIRSQHFFFLFLFLFLFFFSSFVALFDINLDNEITNNRMTELFCANPREVREGTSARSQHFFFFFFFFVLFSFLLL